MKELITFLSLISLLSFSSELPHFTFSGIESFHDCSGEKGKVSLFIIGSLSEEVGAVTLPNYNIEKMGDFQCALGKNEGEKDPARSHVITCTIEGNFEPKAFILDEPKVNGFDFLNEKGESTWPTEAEQATFLIGECGERVELDKENLFFEKSERSGLLSGSAYEDPVKTIRKDVVDKALRALPPRNKTTQEVMMTRMKSIRTFYSLTDMEAAYMVYKWEYENLQYDCYNYNHDRDAIDFTEEGTYSSGVGVCDGFARLYVSLCGAMGVEAYRVVGYSKAGDFVPGVKPKASDHAWNAIKVDGNYYVLDATWGIGSCEEDDYVPLLRDSYFCTKPEAFIRTHLPADNKFQLVYPTITLEEFSNMLEIGMEFYEYGMTKIEPDLAFFDIDDGKIEVEITFEPSDEAIAFNYHLFQKRANSYTEKENACWIVKKETTATFTCYANKYGKYILEIYGGPAGDEGLPYLLEYEIKSKRTIYDNPAGFPLAYGLYASTKTELIEPIYNPLPRGEMVNFKVRTTTFKNLYVINDENEFELDNDGNGLFTGEVYIVGEKVSIATKLLNKYRTILEYTTKISPNVEFEPTLPDKFIDHAPEHKLYSPQFGILKIGQTYEFKIRCKKCGDLAVLDGSKYILDKNEETNIYTKTITIKGETGSVMLIDKNGKKISTYYIYKASL